MMKKLILFGLIAFATFQTKAQSWNLAGNGGTSPSSNFIGTTDDVDIIFKRSNERAGLLNYADKNTSFGVSALSPTSTGTFNTAIGKSALSVNTTGGGNTAHGAQALFNNNTGNGNTAIGSNALQSNDVGNGNTASGQSALSRNMKGSDNVANGRSSLLYNTEGNFNTAIGAGTFVSNTKGSCNTGLGAYTDVASEGLTNATAIGYAAVVNASNTIQLGNSSVKKVFVGDGYAILITTGLQITGGMPAAGKVLTAVDASGAATWQTPMGGGWGLTGTAGTIDGTNFIGTTDNIPLNIRVNNQKAGRIDANNAFYGYQSGNARTTGGYNTASGYQALYANTTGDGNTAIGDRSLLANTIGNYNTAIGSLALNSNIDGKYNTAIGYTADVNAGLTNATAIGSGAKATVSNAIQLGDVAITKVFAGVGNKATTITGNLQITGGKISTAAGIALNIEVNNEKAGNIDPTLFNTFYGYQSGTVNTGSANTANGYQAFYANTTGWYNTANGYAALYYNNTGNYNTANGYRTLKNNTAGNYNTALGSDALSLNNTGNNNTALGYKADVGMFDLTNATAIGAGAIVNISNKVRLGDPAVTVVEIAATAIYTGSDARFKTNISETEVKGLEFIKKLRPVVYNFDTKKFQAFLTQNMPADVRKEYMNKDFSASAAIRQSGFIAQEVEKAAQEIGYDFNGIHKPENANDNYSLAYSQFVVPLVKGMQEQQKQIEDQQKVNQQLQQQIDELKKLIVGNSSLTKDVANKEVGAANAEDINLYPNPTTGIFTITASHIDNGVIEIYDIAGNNMQKTTFNNAKAGYQLNVSGYAKGVYLLNIIANNKRYTKKLVIQ